MARLLDISCEYQSVTDGIEMDSFNGGNVNTTDFRSGASSYQCKPSATQNNFFTTFSAAGISTNVYARACIFLKAAPTSTVTIWKIFDGAGPTDRIGIKVTNGKVLQLFDLTAGTQIGSNSEVLTLSRWYILEMRWNTSTYEARLDTRSFASGTPTTPGTSVTDMVVGTTVTDATLEVSFDDISINDSSGSNQTFYPGNSKLLVLKPDAAGDVNTFATQTGGTAGAGNNFTRVNEITPDNATSFNGSSTLNQEDLFNFAASGLSLIDKINVVSVDCRFRNSTADATAAIKFEIEKTGSGTILQSSAIVPNSTTFKKNAIAAPRIAPLITYTDPDGAQWTQATLDTLQAGYKLTTGPGTAGRRIDVTTLKVIVDYTPGLVARDISDIQNAGGVNAIQAPNRAASY